MNSSMSLALSGVMPDAGVVTFDSELAEAGASRRAVEFLCVFWFIYKFLYECRTIPEFLGELPFQ
jgi:hypothetical protein